MGRAATWIIAGMVMLAGAFVAGDIVDPFEPGSSTTSLSRTPTPSPSLTPTTEPTEEPTPDPHAADSYYTTDGSVPALFPECSGALGLCLGGPVDRATASFGIEDERFRGSGTGIDPARLEHG